MGKTGKGRSLAGAEAFFQHRNRGTEQECDVIEEARDRIRQNEPDQGEDGKEEHQCTGHKGRLEIGMDVVGTPHFQNEQLECKSGTD